MVNLFETLHERDEVLFSTGEAEVQQIWWPTAMCYSFKARYSRQRLALNKIRNKKPIEPNHASWTRLDFLEYNKQLSFLYDGNRLIGSRTVRFTCVLESTDNETSVRPCVCWDCRLPNTEEEHMSWVDLYIIREKLTGYRMADHTACMLVSYHVKLCMNPVTQCIS